MCKIKKTSVSPQILIWMLWNLPFGWLKSKTVFLPSTGIQWSWTTQPRRPKPSVCWTIWWQSCRGKPRFRVEKTAFCLRSSWATTPTSSRYQPATVRQGKMSLPWSLFSSHWNIMLKQWVAVNTKQVSVVSCSDTLSAQTNLSYVFVHVIWRSSHSWLMWCPLTQKTFT